MSWRIQWAGAHRIDRGKQRELLERRVRERDERNGELTGKVNSPQLSPEQLL